LELDKDIGIQFTGRRPGEKLFEELNCRGERHRPTSHPKIMVADSEKADLPALRQALQQLQEIADGTRTPIIEALQTIVPQYAAARPARQLDAGPDELQATSHVVPPHPSSAESSPDIIPIDAALGRQSRSQRNAA
jgi:hypothetical protein